MIFTGPGFKCLGCNGLMGGITDWLPSRSAPIQTTSSTGTASVPNAVFVPSAVPTTSSPFPPPWGQIGPTDGGGAAPETPSGVVEDTKPWYKTKLGLAAIGGTLIAGWLLFKR